MKLLPLNSEKRIPLWKIIMGVLFGLIMFATSFTCMNQNRPKDIPIEVLK